MIILTIKTPPKVINAELVQEFAVCPAKEEDPDPYAIYAVYGKDDSRCIYTGELQQCETMLIHIMAKLDPSGYDRLEL